MYAGDMQPELMSPVTGDSVYTESLDRAGPGLHHVCVEASGVPPYVEIAQFPDKIRAFFDYVEQEQQ